MAHLFEKERRCLEPAIEAYGYVLLQVSLDRIPTWCAHLLYFSRDLPNATKSLLTSPNFQIIITHSISYRIPSNFIDGLIYTCTRCYYILTTQINLFEFPNFTPSARNPQMIECTVNEQ